MKIKKLTFIYGGPSLEHEISVKSFQNIYETIKTNPNFLIRKIFIDKKGVPDRELKFVKDEIVWPIMHGEFGEDGEIQKILEKQNIKFIGNSSKASRLTIDKIKTGNILKKYKIKTPKVLFTKNNLESPLFIKPVESGSSVGLVKYNQKSILIQEFVSGREFTCGVILKDKTFMALVPSEMVLEKDKIFDYKNKYNSKIKNEYTPPQNLDQKTLKEIQALALKTHKITGCKDYSRTDMILNSKNELVVLEINSIPGMTKGSLVPQQLENMGIATSEFVDIMVENNS